MRLQVGLGPYGVDVGRPAMQHFLGIQIDEFDIGALIITVIAAEQQIAGIGARPRRVGEAEPRLSGNAGGLLDDQLVLIPQIADHVGDRVTIDQHPGRAYEVFRCHGQRQSGVSDETEPLVSLCGIGGLAGDRTEQDHTDKRSNTDQADDPQLDLPEHQTLKHSDPPKIGIQSLRTYPQVFVHFVR